MHIKASQRAGSGALAAHLLNANDNEHISVHEVRGFMSDDVHGAFKEIEAVSKGTKCVQFMFSLSLNPPIGADVSTQQFMETADHIEEKMGLSDQPRVVVFHEKENRQHAHIVWSRIDADSMKAINLPFFKTRLNEIARDLYLDNGWELPQGYIDSLKRDPLNYSLEEYQQAKRLDEDPKVLKAVLQRCWSNSDDRKSFEASLKEYGFFLARGDRRGFVAVSMTGEVLSLSRWLGVKTKELSAKLGNKDSLPSVNQIKSVIATTHKKRFETFQVKLDLEKQKRLQPLLSERTTLIQEQRKDRAMLYEKQMQRTRIESTKRQERYRDGIFGLWDRLRGRTKAIAAQNEQEVMDCTKRDNLEWDHLKISQRKSRIHILHCIKATKRDLQSQQRRINEVLSPQSSSRENAHMRSIQRIRGKDMDLGR